MAYGIFSVRQARAAGYRDAQIRANVDRGRWHKPSRGVLEVAGREARPGDQIVRELLAAGPRAVVGFAVAARIHGWDLPVLPPTPTLILPKGARAAKGAHFVGLRREEVTLRGVVPVTTPACTAIDLAAILPVDAAVIMLDGALRSGQVNLDDLEKATSRRRVGIGAARRSLLLADPLAGSVAESEARLLFHRAALPPPISSSPFSSVICGPGWTLPGRPNDIGGDRRSPVAHRQRGVSARSNQAECAGPRRMAGTAIHRRGHSATARICRGRGAPGALGW